MKNLIAWEFRRLGRDRTFLAVGLALLLISFVALAYGEVTLQRQNHVVEKLSTLVKSSDNAYFQARFGDSEEFGRAAYYFGRAVGHEPRPEAALSLGQRDLHSYHQIVRLRSLYANLFDGSFENPLSQVSGHFDLAFVMVFLLPLLVIVVGFDMLSRESEGRTLPLLRSSGVLVSQLLAIRFALRLFLFGSLVGSIVLVAGLSVGADWKIVACWLLLLGLYLLFWFSLTALVVSQAWTSARNAVTLLAVWVVLTLVGPSMLNLLLPKETTQSGARLTISARQKVNSGWDIPKSETRRDAETFDPAYRSAPEFGIPFNWAWYYAMHDVGDSSVAQQAQQYLNALGKREQRALEWSLLLPPVRLQLLLDQLSATDLQSNIDYLQYVGRSREAMRKQYLPLVFAEEKLSKDELLELHETLNEDRFQPRPRVSSVAAYGWSILLLTLALTSLASWSISGIETRLRRRQERW